MMSKQVAIISIVLAFAQLSLAASSRFFLVDNGRQLRAAEAGDAAVKICTEGCDGLNERLRNAARSGDAAEAKKLILQGASPDSTTRFGSTALYIAAAAGYASVVRVLISAGAKVVGLEAGYDPLIIAAGNGHVDIVRILTLAGANVNHKDYFNDRTPLMNACAKAHPQVVEALIAAGADLDIKDLFGRTALNLAISYGEAGIAITLVEAGANVNLEDKDFITPLMVAASDGLLDVVKTLLAAGANKDVISKDGETALSQAQRAGHTDIAALLSEGTG